jgi:hypothetical protein
VTSNAIQFAEEKFARGNFGGGGELRSEHNFAG